MITFFKKWFDYFDICHLFKNFKYFFKLKINLYIVDTILYVLLKINYNILQFEEFETLYYTSVRNDSHDPDPDGGPYICKGTLIKLDNTRSHKNKSNRF